MTWKQVVNSDTGTADLFGGDDVDKISKLFSGVDVDDVDINSDYKFRNGKLQIANPANTFKYNIVPSAIAADRNLTLPLITGTDTIAVLGLDQVFSQPQEIRKDTSASLLRLYRETNFGVNSGVGMQFDGKNDAGTRKTFGNLYVYTSDPVAGSEDSGFAVDGLDNGATQNILYVEKHSMGFGNTQVNFNDTGLTADRQYSFPNVTTTLAGLDLDNNFPVVQTIKFNTEGDTNADMFNLHRDTNTVGKTWELNFNAKDSASNTQAYAALRAEIVDNTSTSEDGYLHLVTTKAGTETVALSIKTTGATFPILSTFDDYQDHKVISAPASPSAGYLRLYSKTIDSNNEGLFVKEKVNGAVVEVQYA